jgi:hypothetical protein
LQSKASTKKKPTAKANPEARSPKEQKDQRAIRTARRAKALEDRQQELEVAEKEEKRFAKRRRTIPLWAGAVRRRLRCP